MTDPTWLDEFVQRIPNDKLRADFLRYWQKLRRTNEDDELLQLVTFMGVLVAIMQDIPSEALRLARDLPKDPILEKLESTRAGWNQLFDKMNEPELSKRIDAFNKAFGNLERYSKGTELRNNFAVAIASAIGGGFLTWFILQITHHIA